MDFIKDWFISADNKTGCRFIPVDAVNNPHTLAYYERNGLNLFFHVRVMKEIFIM